NCLVAGDKRVFLFDWDYSGPIHAGVELTDAALSFAGGLPTPDRVLVRTFLDAYREAGGRIVPADELDAAPREGDVDWLLRNVEAAILAAAAGRPDTESTRRADELARDWLPKRDLFRQWVGVITRGQELP